MTQTEAIFNHLKQGNSLTPLEALRLFNCLRLSGRIKDLRDLGHNIITENEKNNGKVYARYRLVEYKTEGEQLVFV